MLLSKKNHMALVTGQTVSACVCMCVNLISLEQGRTFVYLWCGISRIFE